MRRGGSGKANGVRKKEVVAVEGTENAAGNNSEVHRFFEALSIILRLCKMMDTSFCCTKTSRIISFVPSMAQAFIRGDFHRPLDTFLPLKYTRSYRGFPR